MRHLVTKPLLLIAALGIASLAWAFSSGPPDGRTAGPGESNCTVGCHTSFPLNSGDGTFQLSGPATYTPGGSSITMDVALSDQGQSRWGFEATVLDGSDLPVGNIVITNNTTTQLGVAGNGRQYAKHRTAGTFAGTADASPGWSFDWEPPATDAGPVTFYAAGNAANNNGTNQGDYIYSTSLTLAAAAACCGEFTGGITGNVDDDQAGIADLGDILYMANAVFLGGPAIACPAKGNTDGDQGCVVDLGDILHLANAVFLGGPPAADCDPACET